MQIGKAARSNGSHIKSRLKMEPHGVFKEVTKQCTNKDHYQSVAGGRKAVACSRPLDPKSTQSLTLSFRWLPRLHAGSLDSTSAPSTTVGLSYTI